MSIYLDKVMTKGELQMENRYLRRLMKRISDSVTDCDLAYGAKNAQVHALCEDVLCTINDFLRRQNNEALISRLTEKQKP